MTCIDQTIALLEKLSSATEKAMETKEEKDFNYYELNYKRNLVLQTIDNLKEIKRELNIKENE